MGALPKEGTLAGWMAATDMAGYQVTLPLQETLHGMFSSDTSKYRIVI